MRFRPLLVSVISSLLLLGCNSEQAVSPREQTRQAEMRQFVPDVLSVRFDEESAARIDEALGQGLIPPFLQACGVVGAKRSFPYDEEWEERHREFGLHQWYRLKVADVALTKAAGDISELPGVVVAEPVRRLRSEAFFNDPKAREQWALKNSGSASGTYKPGIDVNAEPVWTHFTAGRSDVIVAVIDGGVDMKHEDLQGVCIPPGIKEGSHNFLPGDNGDYIPASDHGTHVAGIIAAVNNNGKGVCGVAGGDGVTPGVRILSCAIFKPDPEDPEKTISGYTNYAMVWAADHGAVIANNSWGYVYDTENDARKGRVDSEMSSAIDYFISTAGCDQKGNQRADSPMKGGVVLFSAGNENWGYGWPAQDSRVIAVGALASSGARAYYSNYGRWVDVSAPGGDLKLGPGIISTVPDNSYASFQGTSMACPYASGVAALIVSRFGGSGFTNEMLVERLLRGAKRAPSIDTAPLVDAMGSICYGGTVAPAPVEYSSAVGQADNIILSFPVPADEDDGRAYGYRVVVSKDRDALSRLLPSSVPDGIVCEDFYTGTTKLGEQFEVTFAGLEFDSDYYVTVFSFDYNRNYSEKAEILNLRTGHNNPPVIETDGAVTGIRLKAHESVRRTIRVHDPDGHSLNLSVDPGSSAFRYTEEGGVMTFLISGNGAPEGRYTATVTATDIHEASSSLSIEYELLPNHPPVLLKPMENILFGSKGETCSIDLSEFFGDEDGEDLRYTITADSPKIAGLHWINSSLTVTANAFGFTGVSVVGTDARGGVVGSDFKILVRDSSYQFDVFPNPVSTVLYVRPAESGTLEYVLSNKAGAAIMRGSAEVSIFEPLELDVESVPSGTYSLRLNGCELDVSTTVVKI